MNATLQEHVDRVIKAERAARFAASDQLSLGQIIRECEAIQSTDADAKKAVVFDFEYAYPTSFDSWRGVYAELSLTFEFGGGEMALADFIAMAKRAVGHTFEGYKGGNFTMAEDTPVWVANYGNSGSTAVIGVLDDGWQVVLLTGYRPN